MQSFREECHLLSTYVLIIYLLANLFHPQDRAVIIGIESGKASFLLSIIGISNIFGRVGLSALSDHPCFNRMYLYNSCLIICGTSEINCSKFYLLNGQSLSLPTGLVISNICYTYLTQILYCIVFGITSGAELGMTGVVLIDVIGLSKFLIGWGIQLFFMGIGLIIGPPIIGNS